MKCACCSKERMDPSKMISVGFKAFICIPCHNQGVFWAAKMARRINKARKTFVVKEDDDG